MEYRYRYLQAAQAEVRSVAFSTWLQAFKPIIVALLILSVLCAITGRTIGRLAHFDNFDRFFVYIQPQHQYYPTVSELVQTTLAQVPTDKILVVVGGNSVFRGTAQRSRELWSRVLQDELGKQFGVINLAIDQAQMETFSGVAFRALQLYYSRIIFVGTVGVQGFEKWDGEKTYKYAFWDAYYKGLTRIDTRERDEVNALRWKELTTNPGLSMHAYAMLDAMLYFTSVRNFIAYRIASPDWTSNIWWRFMRRDWYRNDDDPTIEAVQKQVLADKVRDEQTRVATTALVRSFMDVSGGNPELRPSVGKAIGASFDSFFPRADRGSIIGVFLAQNSHYLDMLTPENRRGYSALLEDDLRLFKSQGYRGVIAGRDFQPDDFIDPGHLMASGARKLADQLSGEIRDVAKQQGYLAGTTVVK